MFTNAWENENCLIKIKGGILFLKYKNEILNFEIAKDVVKQRLSISNSITYPLFVDISVIKNTTPDARKFSSSTEAEKLASALALCGSSPLTALMANFFFFIYKPKVPVKYFVDSHKGEAWLLQFVHPK